MGPNIEWCQETWNPVTGCTPISPGCKNCYAERMTKRLAGRFGYPADEPFRVTFHPDRLDQPLRWKKPRMVFVVSMGDLFAAEWPDIDRVLTVCNDAPQHTFLLLTKRAEAAWYYFNSPMYRAPGLRSELLAKNIWMGVTAENQEQADRRIPILLQIPAAVRFFSVEPMLGPVDITNMQGAFWIYDDEYGTGVRCKAPSGINWVICGGESGPGARPMHPAWPRDLRDQCVAAGIPYFFKQWGEWAPWEAVAHGWSPGTIPARLPGFKSICHETIPVQRWGKKQAGRMLDGRFWDQYPEV